MIRRQVQALREAGKPVVASMSSLAASGGYYIAMDADRIVASPATLTGSIGIFAMFPTIQRSLERLGVHTDGVGTTALSGEFRLDRPMGDASKDLLQQTIQRGYDDFIGRVAKARKRPVEAIDAVAQGRVWAGADAKRIGLVDELGGTGAAIKAAAKLAKLGDDYDVEYFDAQTSLGDAFGLRIRVALARIVAPLLPQGALSGDSFGAVAIACRGAAPRAAEGPGQPVRILPGLLDRLGGRPRPSSTRCARQQPSLRARASPWSEPASPDSPRPANSAANSL